MSTKTKGKNVREKLLATARDLFYKQGYRTTGINQIIKEAGVSKASFYDNFPSKDDLCVAYIQDYTGEDLRLLKAEINRRAAPFDRYMAFMRALEPHSVDQDYKGCGFLNICVELDDPQHPVRKEAKYAMEAFRAIVRDTVEDLRKSDRKYSGLDAERVTDQYLILMEGAMALSRIYHDLWPLRRAVAAAEALVTC